MTTDSAEVMVRGLAAGGSGVAELPDGRVVFVPRTAPGDHARIRIEKSKPRWAVGALERIIEAGPDRVVAPCPLYDRCGGCQLQHLPYERQIEWKGRFVADALQRIGGLGEIPPPDVVASPRTLHYRNRVTFTLRRLPGGRVVAGFHALARPAHVVEVHGECLLPREPLVAVWTRLRRGWGPGADRLPAGGRLRLTLRLVGEAVVLQVVGGPREWDARPLVEAVPELVAVWHQPAERSEPGLLVGGDVAEAHGPAFEQANPEAAEDLRAYVLSRALAERDPAVETEAVARPTPTAVDAYCGVGEYGRALAGHGWSVRGIEVDRWAVAAARDGAPDGFDVVAARVEDELQATLPTDLLVVNPPRAGLGGAVIEVVRAAPPRRLVYVSCDPGTLARDLAALSDEYDLVDLGCFDLFPQTAHVETVATLHARAGAP